MAKKRKTLPKDFRDLLENGDLEVLKKVFDKCALEAYGGYGKHSALGFDGCPHELAIWLLEQGANLHSTDIYGNTPLHNRARSIFGNIKSLLELGADVNFKNKKQETPLHLAANGHNAENTQLLMDHGANIHALNERGYSPLEVALYSCRNIDIVKTVQLAKIYLEAGAEKTDRMKGFITRTGEQFEFHRKNFNKESVLEFSDALVELYQLFDVPPVPKRVMHDGKSPITVQATTWQTQHQELWELLVPSSGAAATIQGEVIRISGRIANELDGNGGGNWDAQYKLMADTFLQFVQLGNRLEELEEVAAIVKNLKRKYGETDRFCELGVRWVLQNLKPMMLPAVGYDR